MSDLDKQEYQMDAIGVYRGEVKIVIPNKFIACKPYQAQETQNSVFSQWELKNPLVELEVVFPDKENEYVAGANVYVRPFLDPPSWIKDVFTFSGKEIILVPKEFVVGYKFLEQKATPAVSMPYTQIPQPYYGGGVTTGSFTWKEQIPGTGAIGVTGATIADYNPLATKQENAKTEQVLKDLADASKMWDHFNKKKV